MGQLRLYTNIVRSSYANWWYAYKAEIETRSGSVCEECGAPGEREREGGKAHGWIHTRCDTHTTIPKTPVEQFVEGVSGKSS